MKQFSPTKLSRREAVRTMAGTAVAVGSLPKLARSQTPAEQHKLVIDPTPGFEISPHLYMQFMEPLGVTDGSVEAAWDHVRNDWRDDVVEVTAELAPTMMRWGGIFTDFYRWREGVGPRDQRPTMINLMWGGLESNQVGTAEFVDFCRRVGADPLMCVNFESDGRPQFKEVNGDVRTGDAEEAADWVAYCNDPDNKERLGHGLDDPIPIKYWQLGNETSYDRRGFDLETTARKTVEFAKAMRARDPSIELIGWGDSGWAPKMLEIAGEHLQMLAFHQMFDPDSRRNPVLRGERYRRDPAATWDQLMKAWEMNDRKIREIRDHLGSNPFPLAMTECHFSIPGRDRCDVMSTWATGVSYGRILNNHQRHADVLKIATAADFCGTRWQVNAVMIPVPRFKGRTYLMPVARVMQLYRHHIGQQSAAVLQSPDGLDVVASRTDDTLYLHVVNTNADRSIDARLDVGDATIAGAKVFQIADEPMVELSYLNSGDVMQTVERKLPADGVWEFPAASVSAVEVALQS